MSQMSGNAASVVITERQQSILQRLSVATTVAYRLRQRAKIILLAFEHRLNRDIGAIVSLGSDQVGAWRRLWQQSFERLTLIEGSQEPLDLRRAMLQTFLPSRLVNQNSLHSDGRRAEKMAAVLPRRFAVAYQPQKCFVYQSSGLQGMVESLVLHPPGGHAAQFIVGQRQQILGPGATRFDGTQNECNVFHE